MNNDPSDEAAQKARAERLRRQMDGLQHGEKPPVPAHESPRDFVERKMREDLERERKSKDRGRKG